jgi:hypothetical protein
VIPRVGPAPSAEVEAICPVPTPLPPGAAERIAGIIAAAGSEIGGR